MAEGESKIKTAIINAVIDNPGISISEISKLTNFSYKDVLYHCSTMRQIKVTEDGCCSYLKLPPLGEYT
ncbi:MAG: winged helix-turn-helix domain-containing protein [Pseudomonadota bacterium]